jgi:outer membrane biosynthesis protein TonB
VELSLPSQTNPDWYILHMVRPEYPLDAPEAERLQPVIFVRAAIFVGPSGDVAERMILATNGSRVFAEGVLAALIDWKFGWRVNPGVGRWIEMTWNFRSPYFAQAGGRPDNGAP